VRVILLVVAGLLALVSATLAHPHRYVDQQAHLSVGVDVADLTIRIVPSFEEGAEIFAHVDLDGDGTVTDEEAASFASEVVSKATLTVDSRNILFDDATAIVPDADRVAAGSAVIEVKASASFALTNAKDHQVVFDITYDDFSHEWFIQPFFYANLVKATTLPRVKRSETRNHVIIFFSSEAD